MRNKHRAIKGDYLRSLVFGFEDGLVSSTGSVIGISAGAGDSQIVILAGLVIISVEAVSMAAGEFISEKAVHELEGTKHTDSPLTAGIIMFFSYILAGLIPVVPFILFSLQAAVVVSLGAAFVSLFVMGYVKGKITGVRAGRSGLEILVIGGAATLIGAAVGWLLKIS